MRPFVASHARSTPVQDAGRSRPDCSASTANEWQLRRSSSASHLGMPPFTPCATLHHTLQHCDSKLGISRQRPRAHFLLSLLDSLDAFEESQSAVHNREGRRQNVPTHRSTSREPILRTKRRLRTISQQSAQSIATADLQQLIFAWAWSTGPKPADDPEPEDACDGLERESRCKRCAFSVRMRESREQKQPGVLRRELPVPPMGLQGYLDTSSYATRLRMPLLCTVPIQ